MKLDVAQTRPGRCSRCYLADGMENPSRAKCFTTQLELVVMIRSAATPQSLKYMSETGQLTLAMEVHIDDLHTIDGGHVLRPTLEHPKPSVALRAEFHGTSGDCEQLQRPRISKYVKGAILSLGLDTCKTDVPPSRLGQKEEPDKHEVFADHQKNRSYVFAKYMISPTLGSSTASRLWCQIHNWSAWSWNPD